MKNNLLKKSRSIRTRARAGAIVLGVVLVLSLCLVNLYAAPVTVGSFTVDYVNSSDWGSGATINVTLTNNGPAIQGWTLGWTFPGNQTITNMWSASYTQSGAAVTVKNVDFNGSLPTGGSTSFGFNINYSGTNTAPTSFTVNSSSTTTPTPTVRAGTPTPTRSGVTPTVNRTQTPTPTRRAAPTPTSSGKVTSIQSGVTWYDNNGNPVNAHGGGIWVENGKFYLYGEYFSGGTNNFKAMAMYSSTDLMNWTFENKILPVQASGELGPNRVGERPHILKCPSTGEYVMFIHAADLTYQADKECVYATCSTINGNYTYRGPLTNSSGTKIVHSDMTAYQDGSTGYVCTESGYAFKLAADYHSWVSITLNGASAMANMESPTIFKMGSTYYWLCSNKTGWRSNDNTYATASSIAGPWTNKGLFAPSGSLTWNSQCTFVLPITGTQGTTYMYWGDRWNSSDNSKATYVWQPLIVNGTSISMPTFYSSWKINIAAGTWSQ